MGGVTAGIPFNKMIYSKIKIVNNYKQIWLCAAGPWRLTLGLKGFTICIKFKLRSCTMNPVRRISQYYYCRTQSPIKTFGDMALHFLVWNPYNGVKKTLRCSCLILLNLFLSLCIPVNAHAVNVSFALQIGSEKGISDGQFSEPTGIAIAPDGNIYVVDSENNRVQIFNSGSQFIKTFGTKGKGN